MATTVTTYKRGFFGRIWQILFWLFQALMILMVFVNLSSGAQIGEGCAGDTACEAGVALCTGAVAAVGWGVWILGTIILGVLMMATRGKMVTKEI